MAFEDQAEIQVRSSKADVACHTTMNTFKKCNATQSERSVLVNLIMALRT